MFFTFLAMQAASKNLMDSIAEVYEPQWPGQDLLTVQGQNSEMLWADLAHKLSGTMLFFYIEKKRRFFIFISYYV